MFLALPNGDNEENKIISPFCLCDEFVRIVEPAGEVFENIVKLVFFGDNQSEETEKESEEENEIIEEETIEYEWEKEYKESQINKKNDLFSNKENYYQILGLEELFLNAGPDDFRKAYKKLAKLYHPDKNQDNISLDGINNDKNNKKEKEEEKKLDNVDNKIILTEEQKKQKEINEKWLKIKEAYEVLLDPEKRKKYDSTIQFDDTIPKEKEYDDKEFFRIFGPVFLKNSIWSKKKPVPKIGDLETPLEKVKKFYKFWSNFQSWRDFTVEGEYNIEEASSRYEKRQMLKENRKMKANLLKEEKIRIDKLTQLAYKCDPRIKAEEEKLKKIKEEEKKLRMIQKQKEKEEEEKRRLEYIKIHEEEERKKKEMLNKEKEDLTNQFLNYGKNLNIKFDNEDEFIFKLNFKISKVKEVLEKCDKINDIHEKKKLYIHLCSNEFAMKIKSEESELKENNLIWTKEEMFALQKGVKKFPAGTKNRWDKIREIVKTKSNDDIIQMTRYLSINPNINIDGDINLGNLLKKEIKKDNDKKEENNKKNIQDQKEKDNSVINWTAEDQKLLEEALKKYPSSMPANERWTNIAKDVGKTKKQCVERYKYLASLVKKNKK